MAALLQKTVDEVKKDMDEVGVPYNPDIPIFISERYSRALGKCYYQTRDNKRIATKIGISKEIIDYGDWDLIRNVICHELIHSADDCVYCYHGGVWKVYADKMNRYKNYHISRITHVPDEMHEHYNNYHFIIECQGCHTKSYFQRSTKTVEAVKKGQKTIKCKKCGSKDFIVIEK